MKNLVLAELNRLRSRRLTLVAVILVGLAFVGMQIIVYETVRPLSAGEIAQSKADYEQAKQDYQQHRAERQADEKQCLDQSEPPEMCTSEPVPEDYQPRQPVPFSVVAGYVVSFSVYLVGLASALVAASSIGAEFTSGALANWLTFVPDRAKVLTAKLLAVALASAVFGAAALAATVGVATLVIRLAGASVGGVDQIAATAARGVVIVAIFAVLGFALALLTRHTIGAVGALLAYLLATTVLSVLVDVVTSMQSWKPFLFHNQVRAFLNHGYTYENYGRVMNDTGEPDVVLHTITFSDSIAYLALVMAVVVVGSFLVFQRRDVN